MGIMATMAENQGSNYDLHNARFGGGFASEGGTQIGDTQHNYAAPNNQNLAEAASEIQQLLKQLEQESPTNSTAEQMLVAVEAVKQIEGEPNFKQRALDALSAGRMKAFEAAIDHPLTAFVVGAIEK